MSARTYLDHDWYDGGIPGNVVIGRHVYVDTSHCFEAFHSSEHPGLVLGEASGVYDRTAFVVGPEGKITVGPYTCLNATYLICNDQITIGAHCLLAWGSVITDTWLDPQVPLPARRGVLKQAAHDPHRRIPPAERPRPVVLEDNVWLGFDAVVLPGVRLGQGSLIGCRTIISEDVPPYAIVVGDPARVIRYLEPDDTEEAQAAAFREYLRGG
jgi:acetyltransferase-like isoleucine patch superfamily enzyme